jgi:hypothetical protein
MGPVTGGSRRWASQPSTAAPRRRQVEVQLNLAGILDMRPRSGAGVGNRLSDR